MKDRSFRDEFIAGNVGGIVGITVVYPLDTIKTRLQTNSNYKSSFDVIHQLSKSGVLSMYRGLLSPVVGFGITFAMSFSSFGFACKCLKDYRNTTTNTTADLIYSGAFAGLVQSPFRAIMERLKSVMQRYEKNKYPSTIQLLKQIIRTQGPMGLFQGFNSVLIREIPQFAIYYPTYHLTKDELHRLGFSKTSSELLAGGTAGLVQWLPPLYCVDVVKSHMQTADPHTYKSFLDCAQKLYVKKPSIFFVGLEPALLRAFILHSVIFFVYETTFKFLE